MIIKEEKIFLFRDSSDCLPHNSWIEPPLLEKPFGRSFSLKFAQICDNIGRRSKGAFKKGKEKELFSLKRKFFKLEKGGTWVSESFRGQGGHWKKKMHPGKLKNHSKLTKKY